MLPERASWALSWTVCLFIKESSHMEAMSSVFQILRPAEMPLEWPLRWELKLFMWWRAIPWNLDLMGQLNSQSSTWQISERCQTSTPWDHVIPLRLPSAGRLLWSQLEPPLSLLWVDKVYQILEPRMLRILARRVDILSVRHQKETPKLLWSPQALKFRLPLKPR